MVKKLKTSATDFAAQFNASQVDDTERRWVQPLREEAFVQFQKLGLPTPKLEGWRFTNFAPVARTEFEAAATGAGNDAAVIAGELLLGDSALAELVFVNGKYAPELSRSGSADGLIVSDMATALKDHRNLVEPYLGKVLTGGDNALAELNTAFLSDGIFVYCSRGVTAPGPVHAVFVSEGGETAVVSHPRCLYVCEEGASLSVLESFGGDSGYWTNCVSEAVLAEDASLVHHKIQQESRTAYHSAAMQAQQAARSKFVTYSFAFGGKISRGDIGIYLGGENIESRMDGVYIAGDDQLIDHHTFMDHAKPKCESHELFKGILSGDGRGVFNGKILVREDAQETDAKQTNRNLILSKDARVNAKPELEIYADDVKCTHGATIGRLDENALFYLRARGIEEETARSMLIYAFAAEVTARVEIDALRHKVEDILCDRLPGGEGVREAR